MILQNEKACFDLALQVCMLILPRYEYRLAFDRNLRKKQQLKTVIEYNITMLESFFWTK